MREYHSQAIKNGTKLDECKDEIVKLEKQNKALDEESIANARTAFEYKRQVKKLTEELKELKARKTDRK